MISKFFIERPVLSNVIAILMILIGGVSLFSLAVAQYPDVVPPTVQVTTRYPGASAKTVIDTVALPIEIGLQTESGYPHKGKLDYISPTINQSTGTLAVRGVLPNPDRVLLPGFYVRVRVPFDQEPNALLVPDVALGSDQAGRYVLVVNGENVVEQRKVQTGPVEGELRVIESGLKPDDRVVIAGLLRAIPGQKVDPQLQKIEAPPASAK